MSWCYFYYYAILNVEHSPHNPKRRGLAMDWMTILKIIGGIAIGAFVIYMLTYDMWHPKFEKSKKG